MKTRIFVNITVKGKTVLDVNHYYIFNQICSYRKLNICVGP